MKYSLSQEMHLERIKCAEREILFLPDKSDDTHCTVISKEHGGQKEIIGHIYLEQNGYEYVGTDANGNRLFPSTIDFSALSAQYDLHARLMATERVLQSINIESKQSNNLTTNNLNQMKNSNHNQNTPKRENQLIFVEYQRPTKDGHLITVTDSYRNHIGKIMRSYNEQTGKYEYVALDHAGKQMAEKSEKLWELKGMYVSFSKELLEEAHQRRIESKQNSIAQTPEKPLAEKLTKDSGRKNEAGKVREDKSLKEKATTFESRDREEKNQVTMEETEQAIREAELDSLRERDEDREDRALER